jgi:hypothetical protein
MQLILGIACSDNVTIETSDFFAPDVKLEPKENYYYPALAQHFIYREFVHLNPDKDVMQLEEAYGAYLESRLIALFPDQAQPGMIDRFKALIMTKAKDVHQDTPPVITSEIWPANWVDYFPHTEDPTLDEEADSLRMNAAERKLHFTYDEMAREYVRATGGNPKTKSEFATDYNKKILALCGIPTPDTGIKAEIVGVVSILVLTSASYLGFRVWLSRKRANEKEIEFYGSAGNGNRSDAFRHIYVNVLLHRYVGKTLAKQVMDWNECKNWVPFGACTISNPPRDHAMDLWNNDIGRDHKYKDFRGRWLLDRWNWELWASKVRTYVNENTTSGSSKNGRKLPWSDNNPAGTPPTSLSEAQAYINSINTISKSTYVFYND